MPAEVRIADQKNMPQRYKDLAQALAEHLPDDLVVNVERQRRLYTTSFKPNEYTYEIIVSLKYRHSFQLDDHTYNPDETEELVGYMTKSIWERLELSTRSLIHNATRKSTSL